ARLFYAYADALLDAGREAEAREWFGRAAAADRQEETDAAERLEELDPVTIEDLAGPGDGDAGDSAAAQPSAGEPAAVQPEASGPGGLDPQAGEPAAAQPGTGTAGPSQDGS
ncbi:MAG: hypothetical protein J2P34_10210, partial [Actinobacteria bacterium]|nr:hypothetical protein [Actinomycetota bacterium]